MTQRQVKRILWGAAGLLAVAGTFVYRRYFAPSGGIDRYRRYYLPRTDARPADGAVKVTFLGNSTLVFDDGDTRLMIDGFLSRPPLWKVATSRFETDRAAVDAALARARIDRLDALFVAHSHYDHALDAAYVVRRTGATLYGSESTLNIGRGGGLRETEMARFEPGNELQIGRFAVTVLASRHSPAKACINDDIGQTIDEPLRPPAKVREFKEGGSFDILIRHGKNTVLVKPSTNFVPCALDSVRADVLLLGTGVLGKQSPVFQNDYYEQTIGKVHPRLVIPIHWDNFFRPLGEHLEAPMRAADDLRAGFDFLIGRLSADGIEFGILQGYHSVMLFEKE